MGKTTTPAAAAPQAGAAPQAEPQTAVYTALGRLYLEGQTVAPGNTVALSAKQAQALAGFVRLAPADTTTDTPTTESDPAP